MRLIDADTLQFVPKGTKHVVGVRGNGKIILTMLEAIQEVIDKTPTIDAVPVVRCKDCVAVSVYNDKLVCSRISDVIDGYYHGTVEVVKPDDYCSKGIRRSCAKMDGGAEDD